MTQDVANAEQAQEWNGPEGAHWVEHQDRYDAMMQRLTPHLLEGAEVAATDRVLYVGCGCGETTRRAVRQAVKGSALGVDLSAVMLEQARRRAEEEVLTNVRFEQADAQVHRFSDASFDVAISRFGVMFFTDPIAAFSNVARALRPRGRLAFLCWQDMANNEWIVVPGGAAAEHVPLPDLGGADAPGPFSFAAPERIRGVLGAACFDQIEIEAVDEPLLLGADADDTVQFIQGTGIARALLEDVDEVTAARALDAVRESLRAYESPNGVWLGSGAWLVRAREERTSRP